MTRRIFLILLVCFTLIQCNKNESKRVLLSSDILSQCNLSIQNAIVLDRVSAPAGARRYMYACIAAYEALVPFYPEYQSVSGQFNKLGNLPKVDTSKSYCLDLAAMVAYTTVAKAVVYREDSIEGFRNRKLAYYKSALGSEMYNNSMAWGDSLGKAIIKWAKKDTFDQIRGVDLYLAKVNDEYWQPTPSEYMQAVEPQWKKLRTVFIPTSNYFRDTLPKPEPYLLGKNKKFMAIQNQVYATSKNLDSAKIRIAKYWDDNPNSTFHYGHATINVLKVSPAGHWLGMFSTVARQKKFSLIQSAEGMLRLSSAMHDAFIACWEAKYHFEYVRPVTSIRKTVDSSWLPLIETPAFPEYPSGHSVVSSAAATVLTSQFGEVSYTDSAEFQFGLGVRKFNNFREASNEACISRLYGGIHYIEAIENGKKLGNAIGNYHNAKLITRRKK